MPQDQWISQTLCCDTENWIPLQKYNYSFHIKFEKKEKQSVKEVKNVLEIDWKRAQGNF